MHAEFPSHPALPPDGRGMTEAVAASRWYPLGLAAPGPACDCPHRLAALLLVRAGATRRGQWKDRAHHAPEAASIDRARALRSFRDSSWGGRPRRLMGAVAVRALCDNPGTERPAPGGGETHGEGEARRGGARRGDAGTARLDRGGPGFGWSRHRGISHRAQARRQPGLSLPRR